MAKNESRHLEELPQDAQSMVQLINEFFPIRVEGTPDNNDPTARTLMFRQQPDGTLRAYSLQAFRDEDGEERIAVVGPEGQQYTGNWVYTGVATGWVRMAGDAEGYQLLTHRGGTVQNPTPILVDPTLVPLGAAGVLWNPGGTVAEIYRVSFEVINVTVATRATFVVGRDIGRGGTLPIVEQWSGLGEGVGALAGSGRRGPYHMTGADQVMGQASVLNAMKIEFFVERVG